MLPLSNPEAAAGVSPWFCVLLISCAGALGGLGNARLSDYGFVRPTFTEAVWCPGALWNVFIGAISALISWALYGSGATIDLGASPRGRISLRLTAVAGAVVVGIAGSKWLTHEVDKTLLEKSVNEAARKEVSPEVCSVLEHTHSPRKILETVTHA